MSKPRTHLSVEEGVAMKVLLHHRCSSRPSACKLCRSAPSSLRELAFNGSTVAETLAAPSLGRPGKACGYRCAKAHQRALRLARASPRGKQGGSMQPTLALGGRCTAGGLSPKQVNGTFQCTPDAVHISHETVYTALCAIPRGELRCQILKLLARAISEADDRAALALCSTDSMRPYASAWRTT